MPFETQIIKKFKTAFAKRDVLRQTTNALRLVNGKGDDLDGLVLEQYDRHFSAQIFHVRWLKHAHDLKEFLMRDFHVDFLIIKDRSQSSASIQEAFHTKVLVNKNSSKTTVKENGLIFEVDLNDGLNTGLFLDMRQNRLLVGQACRGKRALNCFSYTCSFGAYANFFGASQVVNVDISNKALTKGQHNYELNRLICREGEFIKADVIKYLDKAVQKNNRFDVIIVDPPSFSRVDGKVFNIEKSLPLLIQNAGQILNAQGRIFISTNFSLLSHGKLEQEVKKSAAAKNFKRIIRLGQDRDFPGSGLVKESYLAALWIEY